MMMSKTAYLMAEVTVTASLAAMLVKHDKKYRDLPFNRLTLGVRAGYWLALWSAQAITEQEDVPAFLLSPINDPSWNTSDLGDRLSFSCRCFVDELDGGSEIPTLDEITVAYTKRVMENSTGFVFSRNAEFLWNVPKLTSPDRSADKTPLEHLYAMCREERGQWDNTMPAGLILPLPANANRVKKHA